MSSLGDKLRAIRQRIVCSGRPLLQSWDEVEDYRMDRDIEKRLQDDIEGGRVNLYVYGWLSPAEREEVDRFWQSFNTRVAAARETDKHERYLMVYETYRPEYPQIIKVTPSAR